MKKSKFCIVLFILMFLLTITLIGCDDDQPEEGGMVTLTFWNGFTGADGDSMEKIVNQFNEEYNDKINIKMEVYNWDTLFTKLYTTTTNPRFMPHIVALGGARLGGTVARNILLPINDIFESLELTSEEFISSAYNAGMFGENRYSFPLDVHPTAIYYNKDLISESELPTTWDEFLNVCKEKTANGVYGWAIPNLYSITKDIYYSMLLQEGTNILDSNNNFIINSTEASEILTRLETWKYVDKISPSEVGSAGDYSLFKASKSVFYFDGPWTMNSMDSDDGLNFEYGTFAMPGATGEDGISFAGSHQLALINRTVTTDTIKNAAYTFINYLSENSLEWAKAGQVPARLSVHESDEFKSLTKLAPFVETAKTAVIGNVEYRYFYEAYNYMGTAVANSLNTSRMDALSALQEKVTTFNRFLAEE